MRATVRDRALRLALLIWPLTAWAASALDAAVGAITPLEWGSTIFVSVASGGTALLQRIKASQDARIRQAKGQVFNAAAIINVSVWLYAASHLSGAVLMGVVTMFTCLSRPDVASNGHAIVGAIIAASYGGAWLAEKWIADKMAARPDVSEGPKA